MGIYTINIDLSCSGGRLTKSNKEQYNPTKTTQTTVDNSLKTPIETPLKIPIETSTESIENKNPQNVQSTSQMDNFSEGVEQLNGSTNQKNKNKNKNKKRTDDDLITILYNMQNDNYINNCGYGNGDIIIIINFFKKLFIFNESLKIPFIDLNYVDEIGFEILEYNIKSYNWYDKKNFNERVLEIIANKDKFRTCKLYDIMCNILSFRIDLSEHGHWHYNKKNFNKYSLKSIEEAIIEVSYSCIEYICKLVDCDIDKFILYMSLDNPFIECTITNIYQSNFIKVIEYLTVISKTLTDEWQVELDKIIILMKNNNIKDIVTYLYYIKSKAQGNINIFREQDENTDKINYYINVVLDIIVKSKNYSIFSV